MTLATLHEFYTKAAAVNQRKAEMATDQGDADACSAATLQRDVNKRTAAIIKALGQVNAQWTFLERLLDGRAIFDGDRFELQRAVATLRSTITQQDTES